MSRKDILVNDNIRSQQVRLMDDEGKQVGVIPTRLAINRARDEGMDLVQLSDGNNGIPVCRITEYGKFIFEKKKIEKEQDRRRRELTIDVREIQLRPNTDENDLRVKSRKANEFLNEGDKVKVVVRFRGRERAHKEIGRKVIEQFIEMIEGGNPDIVLDAGRDLVCFIHPARSKADIIRDKTAPAEQTAS